MDKQIALIGFGEAAYHIAKGLRGEGFTGMIGYDPAWQDPLRGETIREHARQAGVPLVPTPAKAVAGADFVLSLTSAKIAVQVAREILPLLEAGQVFLDLNSAAPETMRSLDALPRPRGVRVCDVAVMAAVPLNGHRVPLLLAGEGGAAFATAMGPYGMRCQVLDAPVGGASAVKMLRSVFMKGFPQVLLECVLAAESYGVTETILDSIQESIGGKTVRQLADQLLTPTVLHAARRSSEMGEVVATLEDLGLEASMSLAAKSRLEHLAALGLAQRLDADTRVPYQELVPIILHEITK